MKNLRNKNQPPNTDLVQNYLESSWDTVQEVYASLPLLVEIATALGDGTLDQYLTAEDIDTLNEVNAIFTDFQVGRFSTQGEAEGGTDNTTTMTPLRVAQAIAALADPYADNFTATVPPTATNDNTEGYGINSFWVDNTPVPPESYRCVDATTGAAVWVKTSLTSDELATVALSGNSDDLIEGTVKLLMTAAERVKLAAAVTTGAEISALLFAEPDTNNLTDTLLTKLNGIEQNATADQTDAEIVTAYNNLVAQISPAEKTAGTETAIRRYSPADIKEMAENFSGGLVPEFKNADFTAEPGKRYYLDTTAGPITVTMPAGADGNYMGFADCAHYIGTNNVTINPAGAETIDNAASYVMDQDESDIEIMYDAANTNWKATIDGIPDIIDLAEMMFTYPGKTTFTGAYTLIATDFGHLLVANSATDVNLTIPSNASVPFPYPARLDMLNVGTGTITVTINTDTLSSTDNKCTTGKSISLLKLDVTEWWVVGGSA